MPAETWEAVWTTVFARADAPDGGNPCPIVLDADALGPPAMRRIAAHLNAETGFLLRSDRSPQGVRLRYFVPRHETEMCVHATIAAVSLLVERGQLGGASARVETPLGLVPVRWRRGDDGSGACVVSVDQFPPRWSGRPPSVTEVADVLRVPVATVDTGAVPARVVSASRPKLLVPLAEPDDVHRLRPDVERLWSLCDQIDATGVYAFALTPDDAAVDVEARQFPKRAGYDEDPATGVAAAALAAHLVAHGAVGDGHDGWHRVAIGQGRTLGRPSHLAAEARLAGGTVRGVRVEGHARVGAELTVSADPAQDG